LGQFKEKKRLWIITRDGDYAVEYGGKVFLNAALYQDLAQLAPPTPEIFCFNNVPDGIRHFAEVAKVKAEALPTPEESEQIKKEQESLPPLRWLTTAIDPYQLNELIRRNPGYPSSFSTWVSAGSPVFRPLPSTPEEFWKKTNEK
jgi:hypothetical protein